MPTPLGLTVRDNSEKHRFEIDLGDGSFAIADYRLYPRKIVFPHTEVPPAHEGQGLGTLLVRTALAYARHKRLKVVPVCPFFAAHIRKHPEEKDLLDDSWRKRLDLS